MTADITPESITQMARNIEAELNKLDAGRKGDWNDVQEVVLMDSRGRVVARTPFKDYRVNYSFQGNSTLPVLEVTANFRMEEAQ